MRTAILFVCVLSFAVWQPDRCTAAYQEFAESEFPPADNSDVPAVTEPIAQKRPAWAVPGERMVGTTVYCVFESQPKISAAMARKALLYEIKEYLRDRAELALNEDLLPQMLPFSDEYILSNLVHDQRFLTVAVRDEIADAASEYLDQPVHSYQAFAELKLTLQFQQDITSWRHDSHLRGRLSAFGLGFVGMLGTVLVSFVFLKIDGATRHQYSRRLLLMALTSWLLLSATAWFVFHSI